MKNIRFDESEVMRSLTKIAEKKGWLEEPQKPMTKKASTEVFGSGNLLQDILVLCDGLRTNKFHTYAEEIEQNYLKYSKAESALYSTPDGNKEITNAHPEGSPEVDVEGDSVVEGIIDRHLKMLDVVNKEPKGKLSNAQAIAQVKKVLGQSADQTLKVSVEEFVSNTQYIDSYLKIMRNKLQEAMLIPNLSDDMRKQIILYNNELSSYNSQSDYLQNGNLLFNIGWKLKSLAEFSWKDLKFDGGTERAAKNNANKIIQDVAHTLIDYARQKKLYLFNKGKPPIAAGVSLQNSAPNNPSVSQAPVSSDAPSPSPTVGANNIQTIEKNQLVGELVSQEEIIALKNLLNTSIAQTKTALGKADSAEEALLSKQAAKWLKVTYTNYAKSSVIIFNKVIENMNKAREIRENNAAEIVVGLQSEKSLAGKKRWNAIKNQLQSRVKHLAEVNKDVDEAIAELEKEDE